MATKFKYDKDTDYAALMERAAQSGDYTAAAIYEQQRNAKISGEGLSHAQTADYAQYLPFEETRDYDDTARKAAQNLAADTTDPYRGEIDSLLDTLLGASFSYDPSSDALYGSYRKQALRAADLASRDALGEAASLTGGRASTAAVAAAQQAGNYARSQAADRLPELEALAYERYLGSQDDRRDTLDALLTAREGDREDAWKRVSALLELDTSAYNRYAAGLAEDAAARAAEKQAAEEAAAAEKQAAQDAAEAEQQAAAAEKKAATQAAADAQSDARTQISLIVKNGGTVPDSLWAQSGYDAATIAALNRAAAIARAK